MPSSAQEFLDFASHGWAMSRFSGCWIAMKAIADTVETSSGVWLDTHRIVTRLPTDVDMPPGGLNIRWPDQPLEQELRLQCASTSFMPRCSTCGPMVLNRIIFDSPRAPGHHNDGQILS